MTGNILIKRNANIVVDLGEDPQYLCYSYSAIDLLLNNEEEEVGEAEQNISLMLCTCTYFILLDRCAVNTVRTLIVKWSYAKSSA